MGSLFGTDGVRGIVGPELDINLAMKIGASTARVLKKGKETLTFLVGSDTRISKDVLKTKLISKRAQISFNFLAVLNEISLDSIAHGPAKIVNLSPPISKSFNLIVFIVFIIY